jgi:hypothetical protein
MMSVLVTEENLNKINATIKILSAVIDNTQNSDSFTDTLTSYSDEDISDIIDWLSDMNFILNFRPDSTNILETL